MLWTGANGVSLPEVDLLVDDVDGTNSTITTTTAGSFSSSTHIASRVLVVPRGARRPHSEGGGRRPHPGAAQQRVWSHVLPSDSDRVYHRRKGLVPFARDHVVHRIVLPRVHPVLCAARRVRRVLFYVRRQYWSSCLRACVALIVHTDG